MLVFAWQLSSMANEHHCESFFSLVANMAKSLRVLLLVIQSHFFVSQFVLAYFVLKGDSGQHSWLPNIDDLNTFTWLFPLILIISTAVIIVISLFVWLGMFVRFGSFILSHFKVFAHLQTGLGTKDYIYGVLIITSSLVFCGTLSLVLIFLLCLWRAWNYAAVYKVCNNQPPQNNKRLMTLFESLGNFYLTLCVLIFLVIVINLPALAVWAKNVTLSYHLSRDHTTLFSVVIGMNVIVFDPLTRVPRSLVYLCFILSIAVTQAPIIPLYMIPYVTCFVFTVLNVSQIVVRYNSERRKEE